MNCKEAQRILYTERLEELDAHQRKIFEQHLSTCTECAYLAKRVLKADGIIAGVRDAVPAIRDPRKLTASIIAAATTTSGFQQGESTMGTERFLDYLASIFSKPAARLACGLLLFACGLSYTIMEYNDTKAIALLEQNLGRSSKYSPLPANTSTGQGIIVQLANDFYKFAHNNLPYEALVDRLGLISKEDRDLLTEEYRDLDGPVRGKLERLQSRFLAENGSKLSAPRKAEEIRAARKEIQEFGIILKPFIGKDLRP